MKRLLVILLLLLPLTARAYRDHRGRDLDSLERTIAHWTQETLAKAGAEELNAYAKTCRQLAWGYFQVDSPRSVYYAKRAIQTARLSGDHDAIFDASILIGQTFWGKEQLDSAKFYYTQAADALSVMEANWDDPDPHDLEAMQSRLWGTLGNFYAVQDSVEQFVHYYDKAGAIFEKWGWWEDCSTLHRNIAEIYTDNGDLKPAKPEYDKALAFAQQSGDSLIIAHAMYGLGRWYQESGKTAKALEYLAQAEEYFGNHPREEAEGRANTLAVMNAAHEELYRNVRMLAIASFLLVLLSIGGTLLMRRLRLTRQELTETEAVLEETIGDIKPAEEDISLTGQEKKIAALMAEGLSTKEIADKVCLGVNTVLWYRKRLYAKFDVHSVAALTTELHRRGVIEIK